MQITIKNIVDGLLNGNGRVLLIADNPLLKYLEANPNERIFHILRQDNNNRILYSATAWAYTETAMRAEEIRKQKAIEEEQEFQYHKKRLLDHFKNLGLKEEQIMFVFSAVLKDRSTLAEKVNSLIK